MKKFATIRGIWTEIDRGKDDCELNHLLTYHKSCGVDFNLFVSHRLGRTMAGALTSHWLLQKNAKNKRHFTMSLHWPERTKVTNERIPERPMLGSP